MAGYRIDRITEDIKRELIAILREVKDPRVSGMLTVVKVDVSNDLSYAKVYISALEGVDKAKEALGKKTVKELNVYYQPETGMVYYTADGESGSYSL